MWFTDYCKLSAEDRRLVANDIIAAQDEDGIGIAEYVRRIGRENILSYVKVLRLNERTGGSKF